MLWSLILATIGIIGLLAAGSKKSVGWLIGLSAQLLWFVYGVTTHQYGFLLSAAAYGVVYARNYLAWRRSVRHP